MTDIFVHSVDETKIKLSSSDHGALMEISEHFTFFAENYKYTPSFKNKMWDGKIRLFDMRSHTLPFGLLIELINFAKPRGYSIKLDNTFRTQHAPSKGELLKYIQSLTITDAKGVQIKPRDYQSSAAIHALRDARSIIVSPTGSGKSLIIYMMIRWFLENYDSSILIIVPTTSLVQQMAKDFADYSQSDDLFNADDEVHKIYSGKEKNNFDSRVVVTTWQSAITMPKSWFLKYEMVCGDECHLFKAKSLNSIMQALVNAKYRIGTTGTLDGSLCNERVLVGNFGPVHRVITTKELIENETLAKLKIQCVVCNYSDDLRKVVSKLDYQNEINAIVAHTGRNKFIQKLACAQKGNTLVLFNLVNKHGKPLYAAISAAVQSSRRTFYVSGEVDAMAREEIRALTEKETDAIIVASTQTFSTGINIKNLHNVIFAAPTKSQIRVLQSIGRGLRKSDDGRETTVYDISDNFSWKKKKNYTLGHAVERIKIYDREKFSYEIHEINID